MARYCSKCGKQLAKGEKCSCQGNSSPLLEKGKAWTVKLLQKTGIGVASDNSDNVFETGQKIVPDIIKANDGEVPIKQYNAATMRSRIRCQYAKGKLQVTNKRILFRAAGMSVHGPITQQYEFAISEVAGVEIKKKKRISIMNVVLCYLLNMVFAVLGASLLSEFAMEEPVWATVIALSVSVGCAVPFFVLHKKFWVKQLCLSLGVGALSAVALADAGMANIMFGIMPMNVCVVIGILYHLLWLVNALLVGTVPDLVLIIKTKGASPAMEIRRKQFATIFKPMVEYTDFGEVIPRNDVDQMITELGALIDDIQTIGDMAIEKWQEN